MRKRLLGGAKMFYRITCVVLMILLIPICGLANTTFTYEGNPFTLYYGTVSKDNGVEKITAMIEMLSGPEANTIYYGVDLVDWSISDGLTTRSAGQGDLVIFQLLTDEFGNPFKWIMEGLGSDRSYPGAFTSNYLPYSNIDDGGLYGGGSSGPGGSMSNYAVNFSMPGEWTRQPSAVPLPATFLLFGSALMGIGIIRRKIG
jgi:hypothetical protein